MFLTQISKLTRISPFSHTSHRLFHTSKPFSSSQRNLYEILGVSRTATATEIKASYYKLAQQYHPDKNSSVNSKDKFSEINNAYETLSDESKRREYDSSGTSAYSYSYSSSTSYTGRTPEEDIFADMFSGRAKRNFDDAIFEDFYKIFGMGHSERHESRVRGQNVTLEMDLSFEESIHGVKREVSYERKEICNSCEGKGTKSSSQPQQCKVCKGRGTMRISGSFVPFEVVCSNCEGYGSVYKNRCNTCSGKGVNNRKITESVMIPRGVNNGELVKLKGKGSTGQNGGVRGDLVVKVAVKPSLYYRRRGLDVFTDVYIHASQAILGGNVMVDTLYGPKIVEILKGTQIGDSIKIPKMGISKGHPQSFKGDHYAEVKVYIPKEISEEDMLLYEKLSQIEQRRDEAEKAKEAAQAQAKEKQEQQEQKKQAQTQTQKKKKRQESSEEEDLYGDFDFIRGFEKEEKRRANRENFRKNKNPYW